MGPHRRRGVGQSSVKEGISRKQKAEVVRNKGQRNGIEGKDGEPQQERGKADDGDGQSLLSRQPPEGALHAPED